MSSRLRFNAVVFWLLPATLLTITVGCGDQKTAEQALDQANKSAGLTKMSVAPLAGNVTIDGQPPNLENGRKKLLVVLNDKKKPDAKPTERVFEEVDHDGKFEFHAYSKGDGAPPGDYVVTFVLLTKKGKDDLLGPDGLKNRYNDPDKNEKSPEFNIEHKPPGKTDYHFDLKVEGMEAGVAGPKSVTQMVYHRRHQ